MSKIIAVLLALLMPFSLSACSETDNSESEIPSSSVTNTAQTEQNTERQEVISEEVTSTDKSADNAESEREATQLTITINGKEFTATLEDTQAAKELTEMLPLTISMQEMNGNEKYGDLPTALTQETYSPGEINAGDILLWGADTLVIFYESFPTSYSYTAIGHIDNPSGIAQAAGSGSAEITIEIR